jgi:amidophosphoribosyltransferase
MYQEVSDMIAVGKEMNPKVEVFDASCFDGKYCTGDIDEAYLKRLEEGRGFGRDKPGQKQEVQGATLAAKPLTSMNLI